MLVAWGRSLLLALFVLYIIWMALLFYHTVNEAGAIEVLRDELPRYAPDRPAQALLLAWIFGSFLQGASGFGVPAAVVAPLLLGLGFAPNAAVVMALLGHAWAITYGSLGSSFFALMAATGLPGEMLQEPVAWMLGLVCLCCGAGVLLAAGGWSALRRRWLSMLSLSVLMAAVQWALALAGLWSLAAFGAGLVGLVAAVFLFRRESRGQDGNGRALAGAFAPYLLLVVIIVLGELVLSRPLAVVQLNYEFPAVETSLGWETAGGPGRSVSLFGHAGALLLYASLLTFLWFRRAGTMNQNSNYNFGIIARKTLAGSVKATIGITTMVAMALTMQHAGMTQLLAESLSNTGALFPVISPFIGALGAFMTGSNTNSNVVFGQLQMQTAIALQLSLPLILAAQTAGGAVGSIFAPAKVIVGCSTVAGAEDGPVLKSASLYGLAIIFIIGALTAIVAIVTG